MMSGVLAAHEQTSKWPAAPSGQASHVSTQPKALAGWLPLKNTTPKDTNVKEKKQKRERERGAGGRKSMGQARSSRSKNPKDMMGLFHCSPSKLTSNICRFLPWIPFAQIRSFKFQTSQQTFLAGAKAHRPHTA